MTINKNKEINDSPDILIDSPLLDSQLLKLKIEQAHHVIDSPLLDSQLLKLKIEQAPHVIDSPLLDSQLLKLKIEQDPKRFRFFFLGHF